MKSKRALVAMSGGVDSSVAAYLTLQDGFQCIGGTMRLFDKESACDLSVDARDAKEVADRLGFPFFMFDFREEFRQQVMDDFVRCYESGLTPNPCIVCNRRLKFDRLLRQAQELGCDYIVTGHYAKIRQDQNTGRFLLTKAVDKAKDQSYFLYSLTQEQLGHTRFPLGGLTKEQARAIALEQGLINARKRDSQDICFIPDGDYYRFLCSYADRNYAAGDFWDQHGNVIGTHKGAAAYTIGQRKGLGLAMGAPVYVTGKDMQRNTVTVGPNEALFHRSLLADSCNWIAFPELTEPIRVKAKARSRMIEQPATVYPGENGQIRVEFDEPQRAITPGQAVVLYDGDTVIGGATIVKTI